jgi:hypothetical protein
MSKKFGYIAIIIVLLGSAAFAQSKHVTKGNQQWVQYFNQAKISDRWTVLLDGGYRWKNELVNRSQFIVRAAGAYNLTPSIRIATGFAHLGTYTDIDITTREWRPHQEISITQDPGKIRIRHLARIEQRFFEATSHSDHHFSRFNWRFRYLINFSIPLITNFPNPNMALGLNIGDEILINAGHDIVYNVFDQNRLLIGPAWQVNRHLTFSMTYQGQFAALNLPERYHYNHILWLGIRHKIDLSSGSHQ